MGSSNMVVICCSDGITTRSSTISAAKAMRKQKERKMFGERENDRGKAKTSLALHVTYLRDSLLCRKHRLGEIICSMLSQLILAS